MGIFDDPDYGLKIYPTIVDDWHWCSGPNTTPIQVTTSAPYKAKVTVRLSYYGYGPTYPDNKWAFDLDTTDFLSKMSKIFDAGLDKKHCKHILGPAPQ